MTTINSELAAAKAEGEQIAQQIKALSTRRAALQERLAVAEGESAAAEAQGKAAIAALAQALLGDDAAAVGEARQQAGLVDQAAAARLSVEADALRAAIASIDADTEALAEQAQACAKRQRGYLVPRLDVEAETLTQELRETGEKMARLYAFAAALSELAHSEGESGGRYGQHKTPPMTISNIGLGRYDRPTVTFLPDDLIAGERSAIIRKLRAEGYPI